MTGRHNNIPFRLGVVAAVSLVAGFVVAQTQEWRFGDGHPLQVLAYILIAIGVLAAVAGALFAIWEALRKAVSSDAAASAMAHVKHAAGEMARPKITSTSGMSTADELEKWVRLRDAGVVNQQEFEAARAELLKKASR